MDERSKNNIDGIECTGCGACGYLCPTKAIKYIADEKGFIIPEVDKKKCINCGKCISVCHVKNKPTIINKSLKQLAVKHKDDKVRINSRSGGAFVAFSDAIIENGGCIFGTIIDENFNVLYALAETKDERNKMCGSKYVQSNSVSIFNEISKKLDENKLILFCGTPCQVAAVSKVFNPLKYSNLILCDFLCHGVPSPKLLKDYIEWVEKKYKASLQKIDFRDKKDHGWSTHVEKLVLDNRIIYSRRYANLFCSNECLRDFCFKCHYATKDRPSDITLGDYWGIDDIFPEFNDNKGISLVILRSDKALQLFEKVCDKIKYIDTSEFELSHYNVKRPTEKPITREEFWRDYIKYGFKYVSKKYGGYDLPHRIKNKIFNGID